eukprot:scaffold1388_cov390-Prasinococcus_capsulatus_cf.AAC.32
MAPTLRHARSASCRPKAPNPRPPLPLPRRPRWPREAPPAVGDFRSSYELAARSPMAPARAQRVQRQIFAGRVRRLLDLVLAGAAACVVSCAARSSQRSPFSAFRSERSILLVAHSIAFFLVLVAAMASRPSPSPGRRPVRRPAPLSLAAASSC